MDITINQTYHNFTVLKELARKGSNGKPYFLCRCVCGREREVRQDNIGKVLSCGCIRKEYRKRVNKLDYKRNQPKSTSKTKAKSTGSGYKPSIQLQIESKLEERRLAKEYEL